MTLLLAIGLFLQDPPAEEMYQKIGEQFLKARGVRVRTGVEFTTSRNKAEVYLLSRAPDLVLLTVNLDLGGTGSQAHLYSDGKTLLVLSRDSGVPRRKPLPPSLDLLVRQALLRGGFPGLDSLIDELYRAPDDAALKLDPKETLAVAVRGGKRPGDAVSDLRFDLKIKDSKRKHEPVFQQKAGVILSMDPVQLKLRRRVTAASDGDSKQIFTEDYREFAVLDDVPEENFRLGGGASPGPLATGALFSGLKSFGEAKDHTSIDLENESYADFVRMVSRVDPLRLLRDARELNYAGYASMTALMRGEPMALRLVFLQSDPVQLKNEVGAIKFVHRTYLCNLEGSEGYVVDLLEPPPALPKRSPVALEAVFYKLAAYEGKKGPVEAPFLIGRSLRAVVER